MLELRAVTYRYAGYARPVLHDLDLALRDGEIVGLVGATEAGKSTICLVASGPGAAVDRRRAARRGADRRRADGRALGPRAGASGS